MARLDASRTDPGKCLGLALNCARSSTAICSRAPTISSMLDRPGRADHRWIHTSCPRRIPRRGLSKGSGSLRRQAIHCRWRPKGACCSQEGMQEPGRRDPICQRPTPPRFRSIPNPNPSCETCRFRCSRCAVAEWNRSREDVPSVTRNKKTTATLRSGPCTLHPNSIEQTQL